MKNFKFIAISLVASLFVASGVAVARDYPSDDRGIIKAPQGGKETDPVRVYKLVRNPDRGAGGTGVAVGPILSNDVVVYDIISDDGVTVNFTTSSCDGAVAGIAAMTIQTADNGATPTSIGDDLGRRNWGYIIVHGKAIAKLTAGGSNVAAAGAPWYTSTDTGAVCGQQATTVGSQNLHRNIPNRGGFFFDAPAVGDTTTEVFVNLE